MDIFKNKIKINHKNT